MNPMNHLQRNFFRPWALSTTQLDTPPTAAGPQRFLALRSLPGVCLDAIPGRYSSSSLPPLFVLGRFAGLFYSSGHTLLAPTGRGV
jgi:hypothetical protein